MTYFDTNKKQLHIPKGGYYIMLNITKIISFSIVKGGSGKTTTAVNLATCLSMAGKRVLLIDLDPQANATICMGTEKDLPKTVFEALTGTDIKECVIKTKHGPDLLPSKKKLSDLEVILLKNPDHFKQPAYVFREAIKDLQYDYILIDPPPSIGHLMINALSASTDVIIPMQCEFLATKGLSDLLDTFELVRDNFNPGLNLLGIVGTMYNTGTSLSSVVLQDARKYFFDHGVTVFDTVIYRSTKIAEAPAYGIPAVLYTDKAQSYITLTKEIFKV
jgi:chromosome partitioning protein